MKWSTSGGSIELSGTWDAILIEDKVTRDKGFLNVNVSDIQMNISASVFELDGKPQIRIGDCLVKVGRFDVEISENELLWLNPLFKKPFSRSIQQEIFEKVCSTARSILIEEINRYFISNHVQIDENFSADFNLTQNPHFTRNFTEFGLAAQVVHGEHVCHPENNANFTEDYKDYKDYKDYTLQLIGRGVINTLSKVEPFLNGNRIHGNLRNITFASRIDFLNDRHYSDKYLNNSAKIEKIPAQKVIESVLSFGMPIPSYHSVLVPDSSRIQVFDDYLRLDVDFFH
uniref:BPI1 domain-containing protein n=1 Tax=Caenorhabditis tropicalis TaxID=1561998 RepID=A0A1I7UV69_9PELO